MSKANVNRIDLIKGVHLRVAGEAGKTNGLSWRVLENMGRHLQKLIRLLAHYGIHTNFPADLRNFELELYDFRQGSAVPAFRFPEVYNLSLDEELSDQRRDVSRSLEAIMSLANTGRYEILASFYKESALAEIATEFFEFTYSAGTSPISVVKPLRGRQFETIYEIKRPKRRQIELLIDKPLRLLGSAKEESEEVYAKVLVKGVPGTKKTRRIKELYNGKDTAMSFAPPQIIAPERTYHLHVPIMCLLTKEDTYFVIQADLYDLYTSGETIAEAEQNFYKEFDIAYQHLISLSDDRLSDRLKRAKDAFKLIVKEVINE